MSAISVNWQFAAAGRDFSGANQMAYGTRRGGRRGAGDRRAIQPGCRQPARCGEFALWRRQHHRRHAVRHAAKLLANQGQGVTAAQSALDAQNYGANATLAEEAQRRGIPVQALGLLAQIGMPIAGLGSSSSGTTTRHAADVRRTAVSDALPAASAILLKYHAVRHASEGRNRSGRNAVRWHAGLRLSDTRARRPTTSG